jgi:hypothetical protein
MRPRRDLPARPHLVKFALRDPFARQQTFDAPAGAALRAEIHDGLRCFAAGAGNWP